MNTTDSGRPSNGLHKHHYADELLWIIFIFVVGFLCFFGLKYLWEKYGKANHPRGSRFDRINPVGLHHEQVLEHGLRTPEDSPDSKARLMTNTDLPAKFRLSNISLVEEGFSMSLSDSDEDNKPNKPGQIPLPGDEITEMPEATDDVKQPTEEAQDSSKSNGSSGSDSMRLSVIVLDDGMLDS